MFIEHKNEDTYLHNVKNQETDNTKEMTLIKKKTRVIDQSRPEGLFIHNPQMEEKKLPCTLFWDLDKEEGDVFECASPSSFSWNVLPAMASSICGTFASLLLFFILFFNAAPAAALPLPFASSNCIWSCHILPEDPCLRNENDDLCNEFMIFFFFSEFQWKCVSSLCVSYDLFLWNSPSLLSLNMDLDSGDYNNLFCLVCSCKYSN